MGEKYRVAEGYTVSHADGAYEEGDEFEADEVTARALGEQRGVIEPVEGDGEVGSARSTELTGELEGEAAQPSVDEDFTVPAEAEDANEVGYDEESGGGAEAAAEVEDEAEAQADDEDAQLDYDELTVGELEEALEERDFSQEELEDLRAYEEENKNRKGALDAIEERL